VLQNGRGGGSGGPVNVQQLPPHQLYLGVAQLQVLAFHVTTGLNENSFGQKREQPVQGRLQSLHTARTCRK
jgi:hypothetical protein